MGEFYFIRHGETDWNVQGLMQGSTDIPLNDTGRAQAKAARALIRDAGITQIMSSPLVRAFETARILNEETGLPLITLAGLSERSFGIYEGLHRDHAPKIDGRVADGEAHEKIEAYSAVAVRARAAIDEALSLHAKEKILFVSHGAVFSALHHHFMGMHKGCDNAVPYHFRKQEERWDIIEFKNSVLRPAA